MTRDYFGEEVAVNYDRTDGAFAPDVVEATVDFLADLADGRDALELGIGTGRIALPLAERGIRVAGIDLSEAMVSRMRSKPGGEKPPVTIGDFSTTHVEGTFSLVYLVFNTIMNLTTQDEQVACFENAAAHVEPGGCFVVEVGVTNGNRLQVFALGDEHVSRLSLGEASLGTLGDRRASGAGAARRRARS